MAPRPPPAATALTTQPPGPRSHGMTCGRDRIAEYGVIACLRLRLMTGRCAHRSRGDAQEGDIGYRGPYRWSVTALYDMAAAWPKAAVWPGPA